LAGDALVKDPQSFVVARCRHGVATVPRLAFPGTAAQWGCFKLVMRIGNRQIR
jgi:hypothetical protein